MMKKNPRNLKRSKMDAPESERAHGAALVVMWLAVMALDLLAWLAIVGLGVLIWRIWIH